MATAAASAKNKDNQSLESLVFRSVKRARDMFVADYGKPVPVLKEA